MMSSPHPPFLSPWLLLSAPTRQGQRQPGHLCSGWALGGRDTWKQVSRATGNQYGCWHLKSSGAPEAVLSAACRGRGGESMCQGWYKSVWKTLAEVQMGIVRPELEVSGAPGLPGVCAGIVCSTGQKPRTGHYMARTTLVCMCLPLCVQGAGPTQPTPSGPLPGPFAS
jgi:hypothetical protein